MKFKKLLVLSALSLMGMNAWADVPDGVWTMPEPQGLEFTTFTDDGSRFILYNPVAKMFFASGNNWNTQASLRTFGNEIWLQPSTEADAPEGSYELWNDNSRNSARTTGEGNMFTDDGNSTWVDHGSQGNYSWAYEIVDDGVRFQNVALIADKPEYAGMWIGWDGTYVTKDEGSNSTNLNAYTAILRHVNPDAASASVIWKAVTPESYQAFVESDSYEAYTNGTKSYIASFGLKTAIEEAEGLSIDVAAALAIYTNTASTVDELVKATTDLSEIVEPKMQLKAAIEEYEGKGFTETAAAKTVLNNTQATKDEVNQAKADLDTAFIAWSSNSASVDNPTNMTAKIVNPEFVGNDLATGWSGDAFGSYGPKENAEHYQKAYNTYQTIKGLPAGVYAVGVKAFYRAGSAQTAWDNYKAGNEESKYAKIYATAGETTRESPIVSPCVAMLTEYSGSGGTSTCNDTDEDGNTTTYIIPNNMEAAEYYMHTLGLYDNKVLIALSEGEDLTIGVKKTETIGTDWSIFDDFSLIYYGNAGDAYQLYLDEVLKNYSDITLDENTMYTEQYLTVYRESLQGEHKATNRAEVDAVLDAIVGNYNALQKNIQLWKDYEALSLRAQGMLANDDLDWDRIDDAYALSDWADMESKEILEDRDFVMTNEELDAEVTKWSAVLDEVKGWFKPVEVETDMTQLLTNPDYEGGASVPGWTIEKASGGNVALGGTSTNKCYEAWNNSGFDIYQVVKEAPAGIYRIEVQGFYRYGRTAYADYLNQSVEYVQPGGAPVFVYMNSKATPFTNVYGDEKQITDDTFYSSNSTDYSSETGDDGTTLYFPNGMASAAIAFQDGMYKQSAYGIIKKGQDMRIGVKGVSNQLNDSWSIWDNFKLYNCGESADAVMMVLPDELENAKKLLENAMGKTTYGQLETAINNAQTALDNNDEKMFDALSDLFDAEEAANVSTATFVELNDANEALGMKINSSKADEATKTDAKALNTTISNGIENKTIEDSEVEGFMASIKLMKTKLGIPADYADATDDNAKDFTGVIENPAYDENTAGWDGTNAAWSGDGLNAEIFGKNFDYYQDIVGLPAGTYEVDVQAYYRAGAVQVDYDTWIENPEENNNAFLYAASILAGDTAVSSKPLVRLAAEANPDYAGTTLGENVGDYITVKVTTDDETGLAVPNTMTTGAYEFDAGKYNNSVIVTLADGATLRIGLKKTTDLTDNWTLFDNWQLKYFGANSSKTADSDPSGINATLANAAVVEFFNLSGARISKPGKGVAVMKQTFRDGSVKIQKVTVK